MVNMQENGQIFKLTVNNKKVFVRFSRNESVGVKTRVRDILTGAFEEGILHYILGGQRISPE